MRFQKFVIASIEGMDTTAVKGLRDGCLRHPVSLTLNWKLWGNKKAAHSLNPYGGAEELVQTESTNITPFHLLQTAPRSLALHHSSAEPYAVSGRR